MLPSAHPEDGPTQAANTQWNLTGSAVVHPADQMRQEWSAEQIQDLQAQTKRSTRTLSATSQLSGGTTGNGNNPAYFLLRSGK